ncbi:MAG: putative heavy metal-binding protein [Clostridiales bacterium]|nr:putative heavy metal-binding protein [Clostridiales bacterium]
MIITTTPSIEGKQIDAYYGIVFGEIISGVDFIKDFSAGLSNFFGGRSRTYEDELINARHQAIDEMARRAAGLGANAVVGVDIDYEVLGSNNGMLMVTASGTAVRVSSKA